MAFTINGIGTTHVTKRNLHQHPGVCEQCGRSATLRNYVTLYAFCIIFVPIIPLRKLRINKHCNRCDRFYQRSLKEWKQEVMEIDELLRDGLNGSANRDKIIEGLIRILNAHSLQVFERYLDQIGETYKSDAEIQGLLAATLLNFGEYVRAYDYAIHAFGLEQSDNHRELVAIVAMNTGKLDESRAGLQFILNKNVEEKYSLLHVLVECFQEQGRHENALALLDDIDKAFPQKSQSRESRRLRKLSEKHRATGKPVKSRILNSGSGGGLNKGVIAAAVLLVIGIFALAVMFMPKSGSIYLMNGLPADYTVEIDGEAFVIPAAEVVPIPLDNGTHTAHVTNEALGIQDVTFDVQMSFLDRIVSRRVQVINPDKYGYVYWEDIPYAENVTPEVEERYVTELYTDETEYTFTGIHFVFEPSPEEITLGAEDMSMRQALTNYCSADYYETADYIGDYESEERLLRYLDIVLKLGAADENLHYITNYYLEADKAVAILEPTLEDYLNDVEYQRAYQDVAKYVYDSDELYQRYKAFKLENPDNSDLIYLAGRTMASPESAEIQYRRSFQGRDNPSKWGHWAYINALLSQAKFEEANSVADRFRPEFLTEERRRLLNNITWLGLKQYDEITIPFESMLGTSADNDDQKYKDHDDVLIAYCLAGDRAGADRFVEWIGTTSDPEQQAYFESNLQNYALFRDYMLCDGKGLSELDPTGENIQYREEEDLLNGDYQRVHDDLDNEYYNGIWNFQITYGISAMLADDDEKAREFFAITADLLDEESSDFAMYAAALRGHSFLYPACRQASIPPESKVLLLIAIAYLDPHERQQNAELARDLNYKFQYPQYLIRAAIDDLLQNEVAQRTQAGTTLERVPGQ